MTHALALWLNARSALRALDESEHPDIIDRHGRRWVWKDGDLYVHDDTLAWTSSQISTGGLPRPGLAESNPNYVGLCAICRREEPTAP